MASHPKDHLSNEVSIQAKLDGSGVSLKTKSRFVAAIDRLFGAMVDIPGGYFDGIAERGRIRNTGMAAAITAQNAAVEVATTAALAIAQQRVDEAVDRAVDVVAVGPAYHLPTPEQARVLLADLSADRARRFENKYAITAEAIELLQDAGEIGGQATSPDSDAVDEPDPDWLNVFADYAERATSQRLQSLWARVLAGEIRKPGAFSLSTLRFVSELDQATAQRFEKIARLRVAGEIPRVTKLQNHELLEMVELENAGLVYGAAGSMSRGLNLNAQGKAIVDSGGYAVLVDGQPNSVVRYSTCPLTQVGREVAALLANDPPIGLIALAELLRHQTTGLTLGRVDGSRFTAIRDLWTPSPPVGA